MGQYRSVFIALCLMLVAIAAPAAIRAQDPPPERPAVNPTNARQVADGEIARLKSLTGQVKGHKWKPTYYDPPCEPNKTDAEAELAPFRRAFREERAEVERIKDQIKDREGNVDNARIMNEHGWDAHDINRFRGLDQALSGLAGAIADQEKALDAIKTLKCGGTGGTWTPPPYDPGKDEQILGGDAMPPPAIQQVTAPSVPAYFCDEYDRNQWYHKVYEPWSKGLSDAVGVAFGYSGKLQQRAARLAHDLPTGDPRIEAARRTADYAEAQAKALAAEIKKARDETYKRMQAAPRVACGEDHRAIDPPPPPPPPHYFDQPHRPAPFETLKLPDLPKRFCSEEERYRFLMDVYFPLARKSGDITRAANGYMYELAERMTEVPQGSDAFKALQEEYRAYDPIRRAANAFDDELVNTFRPAIDKIPVVDCTKTDGPVTTPQPPGVDGPKVGELPYGLVRPQLQRVPDVNPPASFCSEEERVRFLNEVYIPASAIATTNAEYTRAYRVRLNELFNEYMKKSGGAAVWAAIQKEQAAWIPIDDAARAKAESMGPLYKAIMAIPVVPCDKPKTPPITDGPGHAGFPPLPPAPVLDAVPHTPLPECFPTQEAFNAYMDGLYAGQRIAFENAYRARQHLADLADYRSRAHAAGDKAAEAAAEQAIEAYRPIVQDITARLAGFDFSMAQARRIPIGCPGRTATPGGGGVVGGGGVTEGPVSDGFPRRPNLMSVHLSIPPRFCTREEKNRFLEDADDALDRIEDNMDWLEDYEDDIDDLRDDMRKAGTWTQTLEIRRSDEMRWIDENYEALDRVGAVISRLMWQARLAPVGCPDDHRTTTGDPKPQTDGGGQKKKPCPPNHKPIDVGPNGKVGSGARGKEKAAGMAMGLVGGLIGGGGGGGGGGGSDGPQLWTCRIKDKEMTVVDDPESGVSLAVGAKEGKGGVTTIFAKVMKSPDSGTFQTAFLENAAGDQQAPKDVGICGLWGEWKLTVSWTKTTYVDGQVVSRESGGWSKGGTFSIPGVMSRAGQPDGLWKRLGFSNASHGAREIGMTYKISPEDFAAGPVDVVIHVTRPGQKEVTTVPFVLRMVKTEGGYTFVREDKDPCDEAEGVRVGDAGAAMSACPLAAAARAPKTVPVIIVPPLAAMAWTRPEDADRRILGWTAGW